LSKAETNCAKWRRESVPVGLREKGRKALKFGIAARVEARGASASSEAADVVILAAHMGLESPSMRKMHGSALDAMLTPAIAGSREERVGDLRGLAARRLEIAAVRRDMLSHQRGDTGEILVENDVSVGAKPCDDAVDVDRVPDEHGIRQAFTEDERAEILQNAGWG
jgi:hypothetical protein